MTGDWLDGYAGQTTAELLALEGRFRTDSIVVAVREAIEQKAARIGDASLTAAERTVLDCGTFEDAVNGDGFVGLFTDRAEVVSTLVDSLLAIGRPEVADLVRRAIDALDVRGPLTAEAVEAAVDADDEAVTERLHELDQAYYALAIDLADPLLAFIRAHPDQVVLP